jgi:integrase
VREHLGHSSIRVTMDVYGHLYEDVKDEIADRLERHRAR